MATVTYTGGRGSEAKTKFCVPETDLQFRAPLIKIIFWRKFSDVVGWVGQAEEPRLVEK